MSPRRRERSASFGKAAFAFGLATIAATPLAAADNATPISEAPALISPEALRRHVTTLASDEFEGRAPGTAGEKLTLDYLVSEFKRLGVHPAVGANTFLQTVPLVSFRSSAVGHFLADGRNLDLKLETDFLARSFRQQETVVIPDAEIVFAGYGIVAPEFGWDDYKSVDVRNKIVVLLEGEPSVSPGGEYLFRREAQSVFGTAAAKYELAGRRGAAAVLLVADTDKALSSSLQKSYRAEAWDLEGSESPRHPAAVEGRVARAAFARLCESSGRSWSDLFTAARTRDFAPVKLNAQARFEIKNEFRKFVSYNVIGQVTGANPERAREVVVYTAHWDHLGRDSSLSGDQIYNGAIDNAAGVAQLLEIAGAFARASHRPPRTILFIATTAEEKGYLGARHYVTHPLFPLERTVANINLDSSNLWGRTTDVINLGYGLTSLDPVLLREARAQERELLPAQYDRGSYFFVSDQIEFAKAGIPAVFPSAGSRYRGKPPEYGDQKWDGYGEKHYHQVSDEVQPDWDYSGTAEDAQWLWLIGSKIAEESEFPSWQAGAGFARR